MRRERLHRRLARVPRLAALAMGLSIALVVRAEAVQAQGVTRDHLHEMMDWGRQTLVLAEALEYAPAVTSRPVSYDLLGWTGGESRRLWAKAEGEHGTRAGSGHTALQLLYGNLVSPWWDAQVGVKVDIHYGEGSTNTRTSLALGAQGLAPGWFEVEPTLFVSQDGDVSASLGASYDLLFTQRLVLQPNLATSVALQEVPEFGVGSGLNDVELGLRMRYELRREFAPYVGVSWSSRFGGTADLARAAGEPVRDLRFVAGVRVWR
jgi:copper resistance protein B